MKIFMIDYDSLKNGHINNLLENIQQAEQILDYYKTNYQDLFDYLETISKQPGFQQFDKGHYYLIPTDIRVTDTNEKHQIFNHFLKIISFKKYEVALIQKKPKDNEIILQNTKTYMSKQSNDKS